MKSNNDTQDEIQESTKTAKVAKVLIVDDNAMLRETTRNFLESRFPGLCVLEAQDGKEASQQTNDHEPDLILMDIGLPGENGLKLTRKIKGLYPQMTIAIFTSYDLSEYRKAAVEYGADFFLSKSSLHENKLSRVVESILGGADKTKDPIY